jgi:Na+(H+)/acetate symporter ActP
LAALLAAGQGAVFAAASALSLDLWVAFVDRKGPAGRRIVIARLTLVGVAALAAWLAERSPADGPMLLGWAFSFAAAGSFVPLLLALLWARCNQTGAIAATAAGFAIAALVFVLDLKALEAGTPVVGPAATAAVGLAGALLAAIAGTLLTTDGATGDEPERGQASRDATIRERPA